MVSDHRPIGRTIQSGYNTCMDLTEFETMQRATRVFRPIVMAVLIVSACGTGSYNDWPYPYDYSYPYSYTDYGTFTYVRRPIGVVNGWTSRAFRYHPYRGYAIRRHNSPVVTYRATRDDSTLEVDLTPQVTPSRLKFEPATAPTSGMPSRPRIRMGRILAEIDSGSSKK